MIFLIVFLMFYFAGVSHAEDPRWEKPVSSNPHIQKKKETREIKEIQTVEPYMGDDEILTKYEEERLKKTLSTLKESPTPLRLPDTILRVMFLPYVDSKNVLRNSFYAFLKVEDGKWVVGEYLTSPTKSAKTRVLSPLLSPSLSPQQEDKKEKKTEDRKKEED